MWGPVLISLNLMTASSTGVTGFFPHTLLTPTLFAYQDIILRGIQLPKDLEKLLKFVSLH